MSPPMLLSILLYLSIVSTVSTVSVTLNGENVYTHQFGGIQYFLFIEDMEATITCTVTGTNIIPNISFKKEGKPLNSVLPESLYRIEQVSHDQVHQLKLIIDAKYTGGYTEIVGNWTCEVAGGGGELIVDPVRFKTLCTSKPWISFYPELSQGVAREGTTITLQCNCDSLDELEDYRDWVWFINSATPAGAKIGYLNDDGTLSNGEPTSQLVIYNLDDLDSATYGCVCTVESSTVTQFTSTAVQMAVMTPPGIPKDLVLIEATDSSLKIAWKTSNYMGVVLSYKISYKKASESSYRETTTQTSNTSFTLSRLDPLTPYNIKVAASNHAGSGDYSTTFTFNTSQPSESRPSITTPKWYVYEPEGNNYLVDAGEDVDITLECGVKSYPESIIRWKYNGQELGIEPNSDQQLTNFKHIIQYKSQFQTEYKLTIESTKRENSGRYSCTAMNTQGQATLSYLVRVAAEDGIDDETENESDAVSSATRTQESQSGLLLLLTIISVLLSLLS